MENVMYHLKAVSCWLYFQGFNIFSTLTYYSIIKFLGDDTMKIVIVKPGAFVSGILRRVYNIRKINT